MPEKRFSPNGIEQHTGDKECNQDGCRNTADWDIALIDRHGCNGLTRCCDEHVVDVWGYHPRDE